MVGTINERLRTNKQIVVERERSGLSRILFALRSEKRVDGKSAFEKLMSGKPNTLKSAMIGKYVLDKDRGIEIESEDFSEEADSTILERERVRGTKLEGAFRKVKGNIVNESENKLKFLLKTGKSFTLSKRDVAKTPAKNVTKETKQKKKKTKTATTPIVNELPNFDFLPNPKILPNVDKNAKRSCQQQMGKGHVTTEQILEQEPQKEREEREIAEKPKEEIESSAQNEESEEEESHTSGLKMEETNMPPIQEENKRERPQTRTSKRNKRKPN